MCLGGGSRKPQETPQEKEAAKVAKEQWDFFSENIKPIRDDYIKKNMGRDRAAEVRKAEGIGRMAALSQHGRAADDATQQALKAGLDPNDGAVQQQISNTVTNMGTSVGETQQGAGEAQAQNEANILSNTAGLGTGEAARATQGFGDIAAQSAQKANAEARRAGIRRSQLVNTAGGIAGGALAHYTKPVDPANQ